ncbi:CDP-alcohol phosphatidyltransferase family protein [Couchioplanes caeruleus]|uniref:CDP-alcohol phosphatidyltransferase n=2 Tax=Couchioplanes caeruleus TaxID=56438 RepID=A0A1K0G0Q1_9ACTN|nr:CDP-alcohol phosphatidyltransferase family protein [Couchioplanes caeruleus]OJF10882.1 CDP-alcohol phosphatidyltransferase [Couchioplanes caeruleus subsp. caeruleus]ROP32776.1 CDP-alcohol phosphatidyltransferase-like enzyme [Couchioplanes caeruleus]
MVQRSSLQDIREQTYKARDAWWTVLLVDPVAARLVRLVSPYRWITPNLLTGLATLLGFGAAACFLMQDRWWLVAGALLFHVSFVVDCMDGKIARLHGTGSMFGAWFDFMFDRLRAFLCAVALFGGQYARTGSKAYLWALIAVTFLDLFRYVNAHQMGRIRQTMREQLAEARGFAPAPVVEDPTVVPHGPRARLRHSLQSRRIRTHLISGIEFEMAVFIIGPLTGWVLQTSAVVGALLLFFELWLIVRLWQATRAFPVALAKAHASAAVAASASRQRSDEPEREFTATTPQ